MGRSQIGNHVRRLRFEHHEMTQKELAQKVGVTRQTIVAIEKADYAPSLELAFLIARVFKRPLESVFFHQSEQVPAQDEPPLRSPS